MNTGMNRWLVSGTWLFAVLAVVSASTKGAIGVGAMWSLPAAIAVTMIAMGWPDKPGSRLIAALGVVWQVALIGAYWPFASAEADAAVTGPMKWSMHSIIIMVVLLLLAMSFVALYVIPALGVMGRIKKASRGLILREADAIDQVDKAFATDPGLTGLWQEYMGQVRPADTANALMSESSHISARELFHPSTVAHTRLRLDFFRNLPGVFTGIGIIGTFSGLISGLRAFQISQDPAVVQRSLESLLTGVWGAFLISALAIAMAIVVTVVEKMVASALSHHLDVFAAGLDGVFPPRPEAESESWMPRLVDVLTKLAQRAPTQTEAVFQDVPTLQQPAAIAGAAAVAPAAMVPGSGPRPQAAPGASQLGSPLDMADSAAHASRSPAYAPEMANHLLEMAQTTRTATMALGDVATRIPDMLSHTLQGANQNHQQASQAMKVLASRLESVASTIEFSARKTLETVAARLMQSEMNMVSRHHAVADHLGELVQRIEALCGVLQQDRADMARGGEAFAYGQNEQTSGGGFSAGFGGGTRGMGGQPAYAAPTQNGYGNGNGNGSGSGNGNGNGYDGMQGDDAWEEPAADGGGFGR
jgi:hypothetical protein